MNYDALLAELQKRRAAATPPPWTWNQTQYVHGPLSELESHVILVAPTGNRTADDDAALATPAHEMAACVEALVEVLDGEDTECRLDHHGRCQAHRMEKDCSVLIARTRLTALAAAMGVEP